MTKDYILSFLLEHKSELRDKFGVVKIGLFGSYARDEATENSDIDIAVEIDKNKKNLHTFLSLRRELEEKLEKHIDLGIENSLKPIVKKYIEKEIIYV
ncbi:nucleotidyltransferase family protein [Sulfurimonas sp.]|nr:nucleotidyltransferase family protein [Sulfurimonas sp.]